jgi:flagellar protein FlaH
MRMIRLGIDELDRGLGGGIPHPSLVSVEGEHGSGKTVLTMKMIHSMLNEGLKVFVIASETTVREYLDMMRSIRLDVRGVYLAGSLSIYPLHVEGGRWSRFLSTFFLKVASSFLELNRDRFDAVVVDSLSVLTVDTPAHELLTFITKMKNLVSDGKSIVLTFHPGFLPEASTMKLRASSDVYLVLSNTKISGINVKTLRIVKLWRSTGERRDTITLEVNPRLGLRVIPLSGVRI